MTRTPKPPAPVIVPVRTARAMLVGVLAGFMAAMAAILGFMVWGEDRFEPDLFYLSIFGGSAALAYSVYQIGLAIRAPVALRMDEHGISGFYAEPAEWIEIMQIDTFSGQKGARYLGFAFLNPDLIGSRQTSLRKVMMWAENPFAFLRRYSYQIVIPQHILQGGDVEYLAARARAFQSAA